MNIENVSDTINKIVFADGRQIILIGTAHVSQESVDEVKQTIATEQPDRI